MTKIFQSGSLNTTALLVPDLYVQIQQPKLQAINGIPTNVAGVVGTASWGPVNSPTLVASMADYAATFGAIQAREFDAGTLVAQAVLEGANNFRVVRVTDGTDAKASAELGSVTFTAKYSGSLGNSIAVSVSAGSAAGTQRLTVSLPGQTPEVFDNINGANGDFTAAIAAAVANGAGALRGPSQLVTAVAATGTVTQATGSATLAGGTDGADGVTAAALVGDDSTNPRKGMYALRNTGVSVFALADVTDASTFATQTAFALAIGALAVGVTPAGDTPTAAAAAKSVVGLDTTAFKLLLGDWIVFNDPVNAKVRLVSPQGAVLGLRANLAPQESTLNKKLYSVSATQRSAANQPYSDAELQVLEQAGIDVVCNPCPGGDYFGVRLGINTSSNAVYHSDAYTMLTNYIAYSIGQRGAMGTFVGKLQTKTVRSDAKAVLNRFLSNMELAGQIGDVNGGPAFAIQLDAADNPNSRVALGYMQADVQVKYLSVIEKFLINLDGSTATVIHSTVGLQ